MDPCFWKCDLFVSNLISYLSIHVIFFVLFLFLVTKNIVAWLPQGMDLSLWKYDLSFTSSDISVWPSLQSHFIGDVLFLFFPLHFMFSSRIFHSSSGNKAKIVPLLQLIFYLCFHSVHGRRDVTAAVLGWTQSLNHFFVHYDTVHLAGFHSLFGSLGHRFFQRQSFSLFYGILASLWSQSVERIFEELLESRAKSVGSVIVDKRIHCSGKVSSVSCDESKPTVGLAFLLLAQYHVGNCWKIGNEIPSYSYSDGLGGFDIAL